MDRVYTQLYLGCGTYEGASLTDIPISGYFEEGGFSTWREALEHFRDCLIDLVKEKQNKEKNVCNICADLVNTNETKFCYACGHKLLSEKNKTNNLNIESAELFRSWFSTQLHEFGDEWQMLESAGWNVGQRTSGGFISISGFDQILENWDNEDEWRNNDRFWNMDLIQTGESIADGDNSDQVVSNDVD